MHMPGRTICVCLDELCVHARDYLYMPEKMVCMIIISLRERMLDFYSDITIQFIRCSSFGGGDMSYLS